MFKRMLIGLAIVGICSSASFNAQSRRPLQPDDIFSLKNVSDPRISPDGAWVAYTVTSLDKKEDNSDTDIYMVAASGGAPVRLTSSKKPENGPRWSPDGRYLAFLSARDGKKPQVFLLDRRGGDAQPLTDYKTGASAIAWSPDSTKLALLVPEPDPNDPEGVEEKDKKPKPHVITRLQFMRDGEGYLNDVKRHIHVFDIATKKDVQITSDRYDDGAPAWSPDGSLIAFSANRTDNPDANDNSDIYVIEPREGAKPRALTTATNSDSSPVFSPDGKSIAYLNGGDSKDIWYGTNNVALVPVAGGPSKILTTGLDRNVSRPQFAPDGSGVLFLLEDGGNAHLARVPIAGGAVSRILARRARPRRLRCREERRHRDPRYAGAAAGRDLSPEGRGGRSGRGRRRARLRGAAAADARQRRVPREGVARHGRALQGEERRRHDDRRLSHSSSLRRGSGQAQRTCRQAADDPAHPRRSRWRSTSTGFNLEWQMLAAKGFAVVAANPRGSSGYGREFSRAIWADWGNKDYDDVMAAVDTAIAMGVADPDRLGVGGWSYGGILTDHVISKTTRFKAAISGASEFNYLANYGNDHYQRQWEAELGLPWQNTDLWIKLSPFYRLDKIVTPTLVLGGDADLNVPILGGQQLYQGLRRLGRETELVVYPGETHSIRRPSFQQDRFERYIAWYSKYLKPAAKTSSQ